MNRRRGQTRTRRGSAGSVRARRKSDPAPGSLHGPAAHLYATGGVGWPALTGHPYLSVVYWLACACWVRKSVWWIEGTLEVTSRP